jgi:hypothetical protein
MADMAGTNAYIPDPRSSVRINLEEFFFKIITPPSR